jgi:hypothetical protein
MNIQLALTASILSIFLFSGTTQAAQTVATFEDIDTVSTTSPLYATGNVEDGYNGISGWDSIGQAWEYLDGTDNGAIGVRSFYGSTGELSFDNAPVVFEGTYYKAYSVDTENTLASIELYYQGLLVHSIFDDPNASMGMAWVASGYSGLVDAIYIRGGGEGFSIDNLTYSTAAVPEPETYAMFLAGLGLVGFLKRLQRVASVAS